MKLAGHERSAVDPRTTPLHLGLGPGAKPVEGFARDPEVLQACSAAPEADGAEGRMVTIFDGDGDGDGPGGHGERPPAGDGPVVCLGGSVTVTRDVDGAPDHVVLAPGEAAVDPAGAWHAVGMAGPAPILTVTVTVGLGTGHRPRTGTRPAGHAGTPARKRRDDPRRVACLGDSLTRAQLSVDHLDLLERRRLPGGVRLAPDHQAADGIARRAPGPRGRARPACRPGPCARRCARSSCPAPTGAA